MAKKVKIIAENLPPVPVDVIARADRNWYLCQAEDGRRAWLSEVRYTATDGCIPEAIFSREVAATEKRKQEALAEMNAFWEEKTPDFHEQLIEIKEHFIYKICEKSVCIKGFYIMPEARRGGDCKIWVSKTLIKDGKVPLWNLMNYLSIFKRKPDFPRALAKFYIFGLSIWI